MKTIEGIVRTASGNARDGLNITMIDMLRKDLEQFEKEIRADQDKITRHACAEAVQNLDDEEIYETKDHKWHTLVPRVKAHRAVMNTTSIKEEQ